MRKRGCVDELALVIIFVYALTPRPLATLHYRANAYLPEEVELSCSAPMIYVQLFGDSGQYVPMPSASMNLDRPNQEGQQVQRWCNTTTSII